jgi:hypothetical protein
MSKFECNHYVPNSMLRNFAVNTENNHSKIYVIDLHQFKVEYKNTKKAFYVKTYTI